MVVFRDPHKELNRVNRFRKKMGLLPVVKKIRRCLTCDRKFMSLCVGHRLCCIRQTAL